MSCLLLKSIGKQLKSNSPFYKPCSFILITCHIIKSGCTVKNRLLPLLWKSTKSCARNMNALKRSMRNFRENTKPLCRSIPARSKEISACTAVIADLRWKLADLTRRLWGKSSEKRHLPEDAGQLSICFESPSDVNDPVAEEQKTAGKSVTSENGYNRFRKSFTKKITPHARKPIDPSPSP